jgi:hypothetical protein
MSWKKIIKEEEEEDLPADVKRARERIKQGLPSKEYPLIPQFEDKVNKKREVGRVRNPTITFLQNNAKDALGDCMPLIDRLDNETLLDEAYELIGELYDKLKNL